MRQLSTPVALTVTPTGSGATTYAYRVSALTYDGETLACTEVTCVNNVSLSVSAYNTLAWRAVNGAYAYKIYGRSSGTEQLMKTLTWSDLHPGTSTITAPPSWADDGSLTPSGALPSANTTGNAYVGGMLGVGTTSLSTSFTVLGDHVSGIGVARLAGTTHAYMTLDAASGYNAGLLIKQNATSKWFLDYSDGDAALRLYNVGTSTAQVLFNNSGTTAFSGGLAIGSALLTGPTSASLQLGAADVDTNASIVAQTLRTQGALVGGTSNQAGKDFTLIVSPGKGTGAGGTFIVQTTPAGSTGTTLGTPTTGLTVTAPVVSMKPGLVVGSGALGTTDTDGFLWIAGGSGAPAGTPTSFTGRYPLYWDHTNKQLYIYDGGWLQPKTPAAAAIVNWQ